MRLVGAEHGQCGARPRPRGVPGGRHPVGRRRPRGPARAVASCAARRSPRRPARARQLAQPPEVATARHEPAAPVDELAQRPRVVLEHDVGAEHDDGRAGIEPGFARRRAHAPHRVAGARQQLGVRARAVAAGRVRRRSGAARRAAGQTPSTAFSARLSATTAAAMPRPIFQPRVTASPPPRARAATPSSR